MAKVIFGNHAAVVVPRQDRDRIRRFYGGKLNVLASLGLVAAVCCSAVAGSCVRGRQLRPAGAGGAADDLSGTAGAA